MVELKANAEFGRTEATKLNSLGLGSSKSGFSLTLAAEQLTENIDRVNEIASNIKREEEIIIGLESELEY
jgi:hypothetical protein